MVYTDAYQSKCDQHIKTITDTKPTTDLSLHLYSGQRVSLSLSLLSLSFSLLNGQFLIPSTASQCFHWRMLSRANFQNNPRVYWQPGNATDILCERSVKRNKVLPLVVETVKFRHTCCDSQTP